MQAMDRRASDKVPWWSHPAWWTLFGALLLNMVMAIYKFAALDQQVNDLQHMMEQQHSIMLQLLQR